MPNLGPVATLDQFMAKPSDKVPNELRSAPRAQPIVLAVDDDPAILRIIESQLTRHDFVVKTASSGEEALELLKRLTPSVLILDVMMDGISGYD